MMHLVIQWPRLGPYHLARLSAAARLLRPHGIRVTALETASSDDTYRWSEHGGATPVETVVALAGENYDGVSAARMWFAVSRVLDRLRPDAVAICGYSTADALSALTWCKFHRRTAVLMSESKADDCGRQGLRERIKAAIAGRFDAALCGGTPHRAYLQDLGFPPSRISTGYDAVDNDFFRLGADAARRNPGAFRHLPGLSARRPFYLASARFIPRKNLPGLLDAYASYRRRAGRDPRGLVLLGDGPERGALEAKIAERQIPDVTLAGFRQLHDLPAYYGLAAAFVHPPLQEQWGLVVNEAMASGLPVLVSSQSGCATDLVANGENGFTFDAGALDQLADLLVYLDSPEIDLPAMGEASLRRVACWGLERFAEGLHCAVRSAAAPATTPTNCRIAEV